MSRKDDRGDGAGKLELGDDGAGRPELGDGGRPKLDRSGVSPELNRSEGPPEPDRSEGPPRQDRSGVPPKLDRGYAPERVDSPCRPDKLDRSSVPDKLDLAAIERRTYASYHEDGLEEIVAGVIAVGLSIVMLTAGKPWLIQFALIPLIFLFAAGRQWITYPRIGYSRPSPRRLAAANRFGLGLCSLLLALTSVLIAAIWVRSSGQPSPLARFTPSLLGLYFGLPIAFFLAIAGSLTGIARWYGYSALTLLCLAAAWLLHVDLLWGLGAAGVLIVISGSVVLWRFIRRHPVLSDEASGETEGGTSGGGAR